MSVKLLAENILKAEDYLSATEQEGKYIGQPVPNSDNGGAFRLLSKGDEDGNIPDLPCGYTATSDGAVGGTTVIDSSLVIYDDGHFIDETILITDFLQDTADYTEQDVPGRVALTDANTVTVTDLDQDEECWLVIDKGAAHFNDDFEFHVDMKCTANGANNDRCSVWALANTVDTLRDIDVAGGDYLTVYWLESGGSNHLALEECNGGFTTVDASSAMTIGTQYYLKIVRDESVGIHGTLYCYIYNEISHSIQLIHTLTVTLTEKQDFRYLYWMNSYETGGVGCAWDGIISNLEIVKSESRTITGFAQATGTITSAAFTYQVNTGTVFTIVVPYDFRVELITSGNVGDATFKWSHDGGITYSGRDNPYQANWLDALVIDTDAFQSCLLVQADNGDVVSIFTDDTTGAVECRISSDNGLVWSNSVIIDNMNFAGNIAVLKLKNGRILLFGFHAASSNQYIYISDDNGVSWSSATIISAPSPNNAFRHVIELSNGTLIGVIEKTGTVTYRLSSDGGFNWTAQLTIATDANSQETPTVVQAKNGDIICAYVTDEDALNDFEIKCKISLDGGSTWGSAIDVIDYNAADFDMPKLIKDINGRIYLFCQWKSGDDHIVVTYSDDDGGSWNPAGPRRITAKQSVGDDLAWPTCALIDGNEIWLAYEDQTNSDVIFVRRGIWEVYAGNACPCAIEAQEQKLICDVGIIWHGGAGEIGDSWQFEAKYDFAMSNMISDSPSKFWRSKQDNIACRIVIDMGTNERFLADGIGFFNCNVRTLSFQANVADTWGAPLVDESVSFDLVTGVVDFITGNAIEDDSLLANYDDHHFKTDNYYLRMTHGTDDGKTWKILDNVGGYIFLDTTAAVGVAATDTFVIFQGWTAKAFTNLMPYRFLSIYISAQETAEGYYKIGFTPIGKTITLGRRWAGGYEKPHVYNIDLLETPQGGLISIKHAERSREFELTWPFSENTRKQLVALLDYLGRKNVCLIPDDSTNNQGSNNCFIECYLVKLIGNIQQTKGFDKRLDIKLRFQEIL